MAVYFDHRLDTERSGINTDESWFSGAPLLAVTSYSDESGGSVNLFLDEVGFVSLPKECKINKKCSRLEDIYSINVI